MRDMETITKNRAFDTEMMSRVAEILKTIAHPLRLEILEALEQDEPLAVSEIQSRLDSVEQSLLSHHLIKMKDKGILNSQKQGMNVYYSLKDRHILNIFDCLGNCKLF